MKKPVFNPTTMDIFTKKGREKFDEYMRLKRLWEIQQKKAKKTTKKTKKKVA